MASSEADARAARAEARRRWAGRVTAPSAAPDELLLGRSPSERVAMVWALTLDAWAMTGRPLPSYRRSEAPGRIVRLDELA